MDERMIVYMTAQDMRSHQFMKFYFTQKEKQLARR